LARIEEDEIVIRDPIQFEFATTNILPVSLPTLHAVAALMQSNAKIGHLVIEGHASREGSFIYNYDLSMRRAEAIFREVVRAGVHPSRLSFVGFGEVDPVAATSATAEGTVALTAEQEAQLAANRRVVFRIVRQYRSNEAIPTYPSEIQLPWDGTTTPALVPPPVVPQAPEKGDAP
jgi:outer membrane protein OmpA-like peptidoglycan-associated protein